MREAYSDWANIDLVMRRSLYGGKTWEPQTLLFDALRRTYNWKVIAFGPGHGIQLKKGRLIVPLWLSPGGGHDGHHPQHVATMYSDDKDRKWHPGEMISGLGSPDNAEPVVEYQMGVL